MILDHGVNVPMAVRLSRQPGSRLPPNTMVVSRRPNSPWGNIYPVKKPCDRALATAMFRKYVYQPEQAELRARARRELRWFDVACWCSLCPEHALGRPLGVWCAECSDHHPCHRDIWLEVANSLPEEL